MADWRHGHPGQPGAALLSALRHSLRPRRIARPQRPPRAGVRARRRPRHCRGTRARRGPPATGHAARRGARRRAVLQQPPRRRRWRLRHRRREPPQRRRAVPVRPPPTAPHADQKPQVVKICTAHSMPLCFASAAMMCLRRSLQHASCADRQCMHSLHAQQHGGAKRHGGSPDRAICMSHRGYLNYDRCSNDRWFWGTLEGRVRERWSRTEAACMQADDAPHAGALPADARAAAAAACAADLRRRLLRRVRPAAAAVDATPVARPRALQSGRWCSEHARRAHPRQL